MRDGLRRLIVSGSLPLSEKLPSVRELSTQLTINPNPIQRAYRELETEGYICSVAGRGSYVCAQIPDDPARQVALLQQFDTAVQELLYLGMRSEELRRRIPEGTWCARARQDRAAFRNGVGLLYLRQNRVSFFADAGYRRFAVRRGRGVPKEFCGRRMPDSAA